jgi:hypothetical protein
MKCFMKFLLPKAVYLLFITNKIFSMSGLKYQGYMLQSSGVIFCLVRSQKISYNYAAITTTNKKDTDIPISSS